VYVGPGLVDRSEASPLFQNQISADKNFEVGPEKQPHIQKHCGGGTGGSRRHSALRGLRCDAGGGAAEYVGYKNEQLGGINALCF
jgi:hypothetical protein